LLQEQNIVYARPRKEGMKMKGKFIVVLALVLVFLGAASVSYAGDIRLMFPKYEEEKTSSRHGEVVFAGPALTKGEKKQYTEKGLEEFAKEFEKKGYKVDSIELWVEGHAQSGAVTKLFISLEGGGGCKLILRPQ
jgi:ABC-type glycerol-3-phosphate transport system substrate-binding protein